MARRGQNQLEIGPSKSEISLVSWDGAFDVAPGCKTTAADAGLVTLDVSYTLSENRITDDTNLEELKVRVVWQTDENDQSEAVVDLGRGVSFCAPALKLNAFLIYPPFPVTPQIPVAPAGARPVLNVVTTSLGRGSARAYPGPKFTAILQDAPLPDGALSPIVRIPRFAERVMFAEAGNPNVSSVVTEQFSGLTNTSTLLSTPRAGRLIETAGLIASGAQSLRVLNDSGVALSRLRAVFLIGR